MTRIVRITIGLLSSVLLSCAQPVRFEVVRDQSWPQKILDQTWVIRPADFKPDTLRQLFSQALKVRGRFPVVRVEVFASRDEVSSNMKGGTDVTYAWWRRAFDKYRNQLPMSAELIAIGEDACMRVRDKLGQVNSSVLSGVRPDRLTLGEMQFQLADLLPYGIRTVDGQPELRLAFYYWAPRQFDEEIVKRVLVDRVTRTGIPALTVSVEPWPWFILDEKFPMIAAYVVAGEPPTEDEYYAAHKTTCSSQQGRPVCWSFGRTYDVHKPPTKVKY